MPEIERERKVGGESGNREKGKERCGGGNGRIPPVMVAGRSRRPEERERGRIQPLEAAGVRRGRPSSPFGIVYHSNGGGRGLPPSCSSTGAHTYYTKSFWRGRYHVIHDLLHELAVSVSLNNVSYTKVKCQELFQRQFATFLYLIGLDSDFLFEWKSLRTLMVNSVHGIDFGALRSIRVLDLSYSFMRQLPNAISHLIHLRYLNLSGNNMYRLPESLCRLYHLQSLTVSNLCNRLPKGVTSLINLRHLGASDEAVSSIAGIGKLTCLQDLKEFHVRIVRGYDIGQLKNMKELRGQLCIQSLENVGSKEEAIEANLKDKIHIEKLQLKWSSRWTRLKVRTDAQEILECLQPPPVSSQRVGTPLVQRCSVSELVSSTISPIIAVYLQRL